MVWRRAPRAFKPPKPVDWPPGLLQRRTLAFEAARPSGRQRTYIAGYAMCAGRVYQQCQNQSALIIVDPQSKSGHHITLFHFTTTR